ncbi:unnamed protein product [Moneuplotes crassus]|uniref:Uncharacterized protein n=1 Tax=Euplotes crassus TaxID=5936 RepID=A0AAD1XGX9_EUPCR|nr:unnamed protein product [Moneuplotes crassus]
MKSLLNFEENLPEEILSEHIHCTGIRNSIHSESSVSDSLFQRGKRHKHFVEADSFSFLPNHKVDSNRDNKSKDTLQKSNSTNSSGSKIDSRRSSLQSEIKDLLHKAMRIRSTFYHESGRGVSSSQVVQHQASFSSDESDLSAPNNQEPSERLVTMNDVSCSESF